MKYSPLTLSRSRVLGNMYARCERLEDHILVYLNDATGEKLGVVDESLGKYTDAFTFHLSEDNCKMLASGKFDYSFDCQFSESEAVAPSQSKRRVQLISMFLTARETPKAQKVESAELEASTTPAAPATASAETAATPPRAGGELKRPPKQGAELV